MISKKIKALSSGCACIGTSPLPPSAPARKAQVGGRRSDSRVRLRCAEHDLVAFARSADGPVFGDRCPGVRAPTSKTCFGHPPLRPTLEKSVRTGRISSPADYPSACRYAFEHPPRKHVLVIPTPADSRKIPPDGGISLPADYPSACRSRAGRGTRLFRDSFLRERRGGGRSADHGATSC